MIRFLPLVLLLGSFATAEGQPKLSLAYPGVPVAAGSSVTLNLSLSGSAGANIASLEWFLTLPSGVTATTDVAGADSTAAVKNLYCNQAAGSGVVKCIAAGMNTNTLTDGIVATVQFTLPISLTGPVSIPLSSVYASTSTGSAIAIATDVPASIAILTPLSPCDLNGDGKTDALDVANVINQVIGVASCTNADLDGDGKCTLYDVQRVIAAALGGACLVH